MNLPLLLYTLSCRTGLTLQPLAPWFDISLPDRRGELRNEPLWHAAEGDHRQSDNA